MTDGDWPRKLIGSIPAAFQRQNTLQGQGCEHCGRQLAGFRQSASGDTDFGRLTTGFPGEPVRPPSALRMAGGPRQSLLHGTGSGCAGPILRAIGGPTAQLRCARDAQMMRPPGSMNAGICRRPDRLAAPEGSAWRLESS